MNTFSRRRFLQAAGATGALALGGGLAACAGDSGSGAGTGGASSLTWWDHQLQLQPAKKRIFEKFAKAPGGMPVDYTFNNPEKLGQALQLAKQSNQLPDVHSNAGLQVPAPQLINEGWMAPLELSSEAMANLKDVLLDGIHIFDGKVYSFPIFDYHVYTNVTWFNTKVAEKAGLDPSAPPATYDDFRAAARAVQSKGGGVAPWTWNIGMTERTADQVNYLAQAAGFEGNTGMLFKTGEFAYHDDAFVDALEFLLSLKTDKLMMAGSESWVDTDARGRWSAGAACYYFDGPWCPGVVLSAAPQFAESLGVAPILTPSGGDVRTYHGPQTGDYWLTPKSKNAEAANKLLSDYFTTPDYSVEVANTMSQPPRDLDAVEKSNAHAEYKKLIGWFRDTVFLAPTAVVKNVAVTKVQAETKPVEPNLGTIIQGAFTGDVPDVKAALKKLSDDSSAERERAMKAAQAKGAEVSLDDYAFPDWKPGADYALNQYK